MVKGGKPSITKLLDILRRRKVVGWRKTLPRLSLHCSSFKRDIDKRNPRIKSIWFCLIFVFLWFHLISASVWCCGQNWKEQNKMSQNVEQLHFQICQKDIFYKNESKHTNKPFLKIIHAMQTYFYRKISPTDSLGFLWEREENI